MKLKNYAFLLALLFGFQIVQAQNLMVNGDLESWTAGEPDGWTVVENITQETTTIHGGASAASHMSDMTTKDLQQLVEGVQGGQEYTISYWFYDNDPNARTRVWSYWTAAGVTLPDNADVLRPSTYSEDDPNWHEFSATLVAPITADGFKFEVRVYKQDGNAGGVVIYDDFSLSGDVSVDPEPTNFPTAFAATPSGTGIDLSWIDATGAQLPSAYVIMAGVDSSLPMPADGTPVANDTDLSDGNGAINVAYGDQMTSFPGLEANTTYYFTIYPYTNAAANIDFKTDGAAPAANTTTSNLQIIEFENFDESWGNWMTYCVVGDEVWDRDNTFGIGDTPCAKMSGYAGQANDNEDWLISSALDLSGFNAIALSFFNAMSYTGPDLECLVSTDYDGGGDPNSATWDTFTFTMSPGFFEWTGSGNIDLSAYNGSTVYVGFKFTSTTAGSATWELDDITVIGSSSVILDPEPTNYPTDFVAEALGTKINVEWTDADGDQLPANYILYVGTSASLPVPTDGTPVEDDLDLSDGSGAINISYGTEMISFEGLDTSTTFYFAIYPYTNSGEFIDYKTNGTTPTSQATTTGAIVIEQENFDDSWGSWTTISLIGDQVWDRDNTSGIGGSACAIMNGYAGGALDNEDWLISPSLNLNYATVVLNFYNAMGYSGPDLECLVSTDYTGSGNPNDATWTSEAFNWSPDFFTWKSSGIIDLSNYSATTAYVAFKFTSTTEGSATWEVDNVTIMGEDVLSVNNSIVSNYSISIYPNPSEGNIFIDMDNMNFTNVEVRAITGNLVKSFEMTDTSGSYNLSELQSGIYFVVFSNENSNTKETYKLIIR